MNGFFITFEGGEGSGKSTQLKALFNALKSTNLECIITREPGGSQGGEAIRELLVTGAADKWDPVAETLLFYAARVDHVNTRVKPALAAGHIVLCDRFSDSTIVYQGIGKGLTMDYIQTLHQLTLGNFKPDLTIILDIAPETGLKRAASRWGAETRFESMDIEFHHKVRAGFLTIARQEPDRCAVVDASEAASVVTGNIFSVINQKLGLNLPEQGMTT